MARLDQERQAELEPKRMEFAVNVITHLGLTITHRDNTTLRFLFKGHTVTLYPYSGWHTGKSIKDGRGISNLIKQLKSE